MTSIEDQVRNAEQAICHNIEVLPDSRELLSQNILAQLRNLTEGVAVALHTGRIDTEFHYNLISAALKFVRADGQVNFVSRFHKMLQTSASHYSLDGDPSERLMLKYYEQLFRIRTLVRDRFGLEILGNLESFPVDLDPSLTEYHAKIAGRLLVPTAVVPELDPNRRRTRYYIHRKQPFFVEGRIYYEVTFYPANNHATKSDRIIGFTTIDLNPEYAALLDLTGDSITVLGRTMPITIISGWEVSIRPCELEHFASLFGLQVRVVRGTPEYRYLMQWLTRSSGNLLDLMDLSDDDYAAIEARGVANVAKPQIFPALDAARRLVRANLRGSIIIRYLMLRMRNEILKPQYNWEPCSRLSGLRLAYGCIPFDTMPFCSSPRGHNPRYWDLIESIGLAGRTHELLARRVKSNVETRGMLYTPLTDVAELGDVASLAREFNSRLHSTHTARQLLLDNSHIFIRGYEDTTVGIIEQLQDLAGQGVGNYAADVAHWLAADPRRVDDETKKDALRRLFSQSRVALVYGAAGTGKSTMLNHIANFYDGERKLFLAHTHPAVSNLQRRIERHDNVTFRTIASHNMSRRTAGAWDVLVIDECSTVGNDAMLEILTKTNFDLLVLVGDVFQIEAIRFGNWFGISPAFIPDSAVFELKQPWRTTNEGLLSFWDKVRHLTDDIAESMARNGYSANLGESLFQPAREDEIILCLNYDGLYGINNINRFLQANNTNAPIRWGAAVYKIGDPVLFHEAERFRPVIHNNLKGRITGIQQFAGRIEFEVELDREVHEWEIEATELELVAANTVRFEVFDRDTSDEDDDARNTTVPFQVAYAVSIHRAQGLEYSSVKLVITDANEDDITHNVFYTAVTRAREQLQIYWSPETQQAVLSKLERRMNPKDIQLLTRRRGLRPAALGTATSAI
ncbi:MAG: AAA family ATPase [Chloroflexota bacterium]